MLVLSRNRNERIVFPALGITVEILRVAGNRVRLGIEAPEDVLVLRGEIPQRADGIAAASTARSPANAHALRNRLQAATLGLHLVQRMVESGITDELEATIFRAINDFRAIENELTKAPPATPRARTTGDLCRALVVEDDANESELMAGYLRLSGFEVTTAGDGLEAMVQLSKDDRPDVMLLDMHMPRFDGRKTVSAIRQNPDYRSLTIFAVTGSEQSNADLLGPAGVNRWFTKPVNPKQIVEAIRQDLGAECVSA